MKFIASIAALALSTSVFAGQCDHLWPNNTPIEVPGTVELCSSFFVILYDPTKKAAILASEVIVPKTQEQERKDSFRVDERLPKNQQAALSDYRKSGKDKGHVVPAGDAVGPDQMRETFRLTNMTPQDPVLNREAWRELEYSTRGLAIRARQEIKVLTGAVYSSAGATIGKNMIPVPQSYYKIAYTPTGTVAHYADNNNSGIIKNTTVDDLSHFSGIKLPK